MGSYVPTTLQERRDMLHTVGVESYRELYRNVPDRVWLDGDLSLPEGKSEFEVRRIMTAAAEKNRVYPTILRGAGAYRHYIPAAVKRITSREEFLTAYTPYQAEISQGVLQSIFEYQTMICTLTDMDVSNASAYDGATAAAEAITMCRERKRQKAFVAANVNPQILAVMRTYCFGSDVQLITIPEIGGLVDADALRKELDDSAACFLFQQPNFYGLVENAEELVSIVHEAGAKAIMHVNPIACALLKTPGECGADVAVGEGQPLGMDLGFGGPWLGFMSCTDAMKRKLPGRIVGQTTDTEGKVGYVLTLTAREQHIRREKASSNICSNQALCALTAAIYMSCMGPEGLKEAALQCMSKAHYFAAALESAGLKLRWQGEYFHEFVTDCTEKESEKILNALDREGILGGLPIPGGLLWCATEAVTREEMDRAAEIVGEVLK